MSLSHNPRIVTSGLVMLLDAANPKSYPGTGTTWSDLSGNGNNGTLTNGPTYSSANNGSIVFDGVNDTMSSTYNKVGGNDTTLEVWFNWGGVTGTFTMIYLGNGANSGYGFFVHDGSGPGSGNKVGVLYGGSFYNALNIGTTYATLQSGVWTNLVITRDSNTTILYQNAALLGSTTRIPNGNTGSLAYYAAPPGGNISVQKVYNRALSAAEVQQNFNATRSRYGV